MQVGFSLAHNAPLSDPGTLAVLGAWVFEPDVLFGLAAGALWYLLAARRVRGWPRSRSISFAAGLAMLLIVLAGPPAAYAHTLFSAHMVQHLLLTLVAAPLIVLGAPVALAMRSASAANRGRMTAIAHTSFVRFVGHPVIAWCAFALVMWLTHFTPLYELALDNEFVHVLEHSLYLGAALLFWWPVAGLDPGAARLGWPGRLLYLAVAFPQQSFLGLAVYSTNELLYPHYGAIARGWGPSPLDDQHLAGALMWVGGDLLFLIALALTILGWMRHDARHAERVDRRLASES